MTVLSLAGVRIRREHALDLARRLTRVGSDSTARLLLDAVTHGHDVVALSGDDRERILAVLDEPPQGLVELRGALFDELNWQRSATAGP